MSVRMVDVVEYTDPGCVWSWGSEPQLRWLRWHYGPQLRWRRVLGGQVRDLAVSHPDRDPVADAELFRREWLDVAEHTRAPVPELLAWMHRSTLPASRAVLAAARQQGDDAWPSLADRVLRRLREAVFVDGRPADTPERIAAALDDLPGLNLGRLLRDADRPEIEVVLHHDLEETRRPVPEVVGRTGPGPNPGAAKADGDRLRYGFPTLIVHGPVGSSVVAGWTTTTDLEQAVLAAGALPTDTGRSVDPDVALAELGSLTRRDLDLLTDGREPSGVTASRTATGPVWSISRGRRPAGAPTPSR